MLSCLFSKVVHRILEQIFIWRRKFDFRARDKHLCQEVIQSCATLRNTVKRNATRIFFVTAIDISSRCMVVFTDSICRYVLFYDQIRRLTLSYVMSHTYSTSCGFKKKCCLFITYKCLRTDCGAILSFIHY